MATAKLTLVFFTMLAQAFALPGFPGFPGPPGPPHGPPGPPGGPHGPPHAPPAPKWTALGCFTDQSAPKRSLAGKSYVDPSGMTVDTCVAFCKTNGYLYAGVEFGQECFCDYAIQYTATPVSKSQCNMPCTGNNKQTCGAGDRINIFYSGGKKPEVPNRVKTWQYSGCFVDSVENRALERPMPIASGVTAQSCTAACKDAGFKFAGLEFGAECFCGNDLDSSKVNENQCQTACAADPKQFCGGSDRLTVFTDNSRPTPPKGPGGPKPHGHH